jgi:hypothetical protein
VLGHRQVVLGRRKQMVTMHSLLDCLRRLRPKVNLALASIAEAEHTVEYKVNSIVDTFLEAPITSKEPVAVLSGQARTVRGTGPDGPRPGVRRRCSLVRRGRSAAQGRTVRDLVQELGFPA